MSEGARGVLEKPERLSRAVFLLDAKAGLRSDEFVQQLRRLKTGLEKRFAPDAEVLVSIRRPDDPFAQIGGERKITPIDGFVQVTIPEFAYERLVDAMPGVDDDFRSVSDVENIAVAVGNAYVMVDLPGNIIVGFLGRRNAAVTLDEMRHWWLSHHGPLGISLTRELAPHGYHQFHIDPDASRRAAKTAGLPYVEYDMGDTLYLENLSAFVLGTSDPKVQRILIEDEEPFLDHKSWRGAFTDVLR